jgi:hypothetical protein
MNIALLNSITLATVAVLGWFTLAPSVRHSERWRATVTPLASIIGSGFLVVGPILADVVGRWATAAMFGLCALAWLFGSAIRFNIIHAEPLIAEQKDPRLLRLNRVAELGLAVAYFISVAYYLNLLGAFLLRGVGIIDPQLARVVTTVIIAALGVLGWFRGFKGIETVEVIAVSIKLAVIGGVLAAMFAVFAANPGAQHWPASRPHDLWHTVRVLLGSVILVQGFETSRFLGQHYSAALRVKSMRWAQILSTLIYVAFIALLLPHVTSAQLGGPVKETEIIDILASVSVMLGPLLVLAAVASQLSAAIADMGGGGELIDGIFTKLPVKYAYATVTGMAIVLTWSIDIFGIIAIASRAFAVYYAIECTIAAVLARKHWWQRARFTVAALLAVTVVVFGIPAE